MTNEEAIEILTKHNAWRRGDDTHEMGCVKQLGLAIDHAIEVLRGDKQKQEYIHYLPDANRDYEVIFCDSLGEWVIRFKCSFKQVERAKAMIKASKLYLKNMDETPKLHKEQLNAK